MSRFYAEITGDVSKNAATKRGHKWVSGHIRGWDCGVRVVADIEAGEDVFEISTTGGSNGNQPTKILGTVRIVDGVPHFLPRF